MGCCAMMPSPSPRSAAPADSPLFEQEPGKPKSKDCPQESKNTWDYPYDINAWKKCCDTTPGQEQSPIDFPESVSKLPFSFKFELNYSTVPVKFSKDGRPISLVNNGHTIQMNVPAGQTLTLDSGAVYDLLQFHFHTISEHTVNQLAYPLEMHLVHKLRKGGKLLVLGIFFDTNEVSTKADDILASFWDYLPGPGFNAPKNEVKVHLSSLPSAIARSSFYNYKGSLTTPPLSEGVTWIVAKEPLKCSDSQLRIFCQRLKLDANFRPPQPLGERSIHRAEIVVNSAE